MGLLFAVGRSFHGVAHCMELLFTCSRSLHGVALYMGLLNGVALCMGLLMSWVASYFGLLLAWGGCLHLVVFFYASPALWGCELATFFFKPSDAFFFSWGRLHKLGCCSYGVAT